MSSSKWTKRFARHATFVLLVIAGVQQDVFAEEVLCVPIRPGDTATLVAQRLAGDPSSTRQPWFQILNPATGQFVSKSSYHRILPGWRACLVDAPMAPTAARSTTARQPGAPFARAREWLRRTDLNVVLWSVLLFLIAFLLHSSDQYLRQRSFVLAAMTRFAEGFVREFERPLIEPGAAARPIQSRVRFAPDRARFDVLLAPGAGRRYPNLADHRRNVEYDVTRVVRSLKNDSFVGGRPYAQGHWIVVPFQFTNNRDDRGRQQ